MTFAKEALKFFQKNPDIEILEAFIIDASGLPRGKWLPRQTASKIFKSGLRLPKSAFAVDIWGQDVLGAGLVTETGDTDGLCLPVADSLHRASWIGRPTAQVLLSMYEAGGKPFFADPRHVLSGVLARYARLGLTPVVAVELEFYLTDGKKEKKGRPPKPPKSPRTGRAGWAPHVYSMGEMREFSAVLDDVLECCNAQKIPADTAISENGPGQFEVNILHIPDALRAADHAVMMKRIIKGVAAQYGMDATFMAKPYGDKSGNGMHVHFSVVDRKGKNIFSAKKSPALYHALGGLLKTMKDCTAVFAPNLNSYRRFQKGSHAPTKVAWGMDNRSCALRVPASDPEAMRVEHRVCGADAHPHLALAAILAGALYGIENKIDPGKPTEGNAYMSRAKSLPAFWGEALDLFDSSAFIGDYLGTRYQRVFSACRRQEKEMMDRMVSDVEYSAYLRDI